MGGGGGKNMHTSLQLLIEQLKSTRRELQLYKNKGSAVHVLHNTEQNISVVSTEH